MIHSSHEASAISGKICLIDNPPDTVYGVAGTHIPRTRGYVFCAHVRGMDAMRLVFLPPAEIEQMIDYDLSPFQRLTAGEMEVHIRQV